MMVFCSVDTLSEGRCNWLTCVCTIPYMCFLCYLMLNFQHMMKQSNRKKNLSALLWSKKIMEYMYTQSGFSQYGNLSDIKYNFLRIITI